MYKAERQFCYYKGMKPKAIHFKLTLIYKLKEGNTGGVFFSYKIFKDQNRCLWYKKYCGTNIW